MVDFLLKKGLNIVGVYDVSYSSCKVGQSLSKSASTCLKTGSCQEKHIITLHTRSKQA